MDKSRRKSSFFRRQQLHSVCDELNSTANSKCLGDSPEYSSKVGAKEEKVILDNIGEMEKEFKEWQNKRREVKSEYQKMDQFKDDVHVVTWDDCKNDLSKEDMEFLDARPDYTKMAKKLEYLTEKIELMKHNAYRSKLKINDHFMAQSFKVNDVKQNICNYLLSSDESENLYTTDDSGINCSMEIECD